MITIEQIKTLEEKINKAVDLIDRLREENSTLRSTLESTQDRMKGLEKMVDDFKNGQAAIEKGIINAIKKLDVLEDVVLAEKDEEKVGEKDDDETESDDLKSAIPEGNDTPKKEKEELDIF